MSVAQSIDEPVSVPWLLAHDAELDLRMRLARHAQDLWTAVPAQQRADQLARAITTLSERRHALADLIVLENGKPRVEALVHEVGASVHHLAWLCREGPGLLAGQRRPVRWMPHRRAKVDRMPHGVVLVIAPWNFPLSIPLGQIAAALLAGNAVVFKPSEVTPRIGQAVVDAFDACDLPANLLHVVQGDGSVGAALIERRPDKICFTGSVATGRRVMAAAARFPVPVTLELGGVDAMIVCDDADIEFASSAAVWGATCNGGQVCASIERLLVDESVSDRFIAALNAKLDQLDPQRDLARVTVPQQADVYERHLDDARQRGLAVRGGGSLPDGRFLPATVTGDAIDDSDVYSKESFGPLLAIRTFRRDAQAVELHNASAFGLTASVFSRDPRRARAIADKLRVGLVSINDIAASLHAFGELPWGGVGESGFGRSHGPEGLLAMTWPKVLDAPRRGMPDAKRPWWYPYDLGQDAVMDEFTQAIGASNRRRRARHVSRLVCAATNLIVRHPRL